MFGDVQVRNDITIVDKKHPFVTRILTVSKVSEIIACFPIN